MGFYAVSLITAALGAAATQRVWADRLSDGYGLPTISEMRAWDAMQSGNWLARDVSFQPGLTNTGRTLREIVWQELGVADGADQTQATAAKKATVDGKVYDTEYVVIARSGFRPRGSSGRFGQIVDEHGRGLKGPEETHPDGGVAGDNWISNNNDFSSLLPRGKDDVYIVTHFESPEPEVVYFSKAKQDLETGALTMVETEAMDWSEYGGLWTPCAGSVTPWQAHLGSEEYEPDARAWADSLANKTATGQEWRDTVGGDWNRYFSLPDDATNEDMADVMFPYNYGYPWEVRVGDAGDITLQTKHMAAGRLAIELPYVMPDNKTVYVTDDGDNVMFMMYKASTARDLSCGTIYGAKFSQVSADNGGEFDIEWVEVGAEACSATFKSKAESTTFYDLFDTEEPDTEAGANGDICPGGYTTINAQPGGLECLKLKPGMELLASRFETRRLAAMKGVTTEWSKWEGLTLDTHRYQIYTALSEVRRGMEDFGDEGEESEQYDLGTPNSVKLPWNPCGCVYSIDLNEDWEATKMSGLVCGTKVGDVDEENACALGGLSSPDNVAYVAHHDALLIAEDTSFHVNNVMWYYDLAPAPAERELVRIYSVPLQAEVCGPYHFPNIRGWEYIQAVAQHPLDDIEESDFEEDQEDTGTASYLGYIGPFKSRPESVDMAGGAPKAGRLWNDFPVSGKKSDGAGGAPAKKPHTMPHGKKDGAHGKKHHKKAHHKCQGPHGPRHKYHKLAPGTSRQRSAEHHSSDAKRWANASHRAHRAQCQHHD